MKKIAIFVSGKGEATERIVKLFNEGNRVRTVLVVADETSQDLLNRLKAEDVEFLYMPDVAEGESSTVIKSLLQAKEVDLIVLDHYSSSISDDIKAITSGKVLEITSAEMAPREVVSALESHLRKPIENKPDTVKTEEAPTLETEWANALKINFTPPKIPTTPPAVPSGDANTPQSDELLTPPQEENINVENGREENFDLRNSEIPQENRNYSHTGFLGPRRNWKTFDGRHKDKYEKEEKMPSTWLIWSILVTVFCCFIPGIVAIIFSSQVSSKYFAGDYEGARRASRLAEIWIIVSFVLGVLTATLYLPIMMIG